MKTLILTIGLGLMVCYLGIINTKGNLSSIHWYHRQRVSETDRKPFGKLVGLGTFLIGAALIAFGVFSFLYEQTQRECLNVVGTILLPLGFAAGMILSLHAMFKYNHGIF